MNELRILVKGKSDKSLTRLAEESGLSRNTIANLISLDGIPRETKLSTLIKLAQVLGYRVEIKFNSKGEGNDA